MQRVYYKSSYHALSNLQAIPLSPYRTPVMKSHLNLPPKSTLNTARKKRKNLGSDFRYESLSKSQWNSKKLHKRREI